MHSFCTNQTVELFRTMRLWRHLTRNWKKPLTTIFGKIFISRLQKRPIQTKYQLTAYQPRAMIQWSNTERHETDMHSYHHAMTIF